MMHASEQETLRQRGVVPRVEWLLTELRSSSFRIIARPSRRRGLPKASFSEASSSALSTQAPELTDEPCGHQQNRRGELSPPNYSPGVDCSDDTSLFSGVVYGLAEKRFQHALLGARANEVEQLRGRPAAWASICALIAINRASRLAGLVSGSWWGSSGLPKSRIDHVRDASRC